jgi:cob(I)alamin adenosyltransferase
VSKADPRLRCTGAVDELNAALGLAAVGVGAPLLGQLRRVQNELFVIGSHLAIPNGLKPSTPVPPLTDQMIARLEQEIDSSEATLPPLKNFILPGGTESAARLHLARTICRTAERTIVEFAQEHTIPPLVLTYVNRLSDWLFVQARVMNHRAGVADVPWEK